jgi:hypothetical protein
LHDALNPQAEAPARQQLPCLQAWRPSSPGQCRRPALPRLPAETGTATNAMAERKRGHLRGADPPDLTGKAPQGPRPVMTPVLGMRRSGTRGAGSLCESAIRRAVQERRPAERSGSGGQDDAATGLSSSHDRSPLVIYAFWRGLSNRPVRGTFIACSGSGDCGGQVQGEPEVTGEQVPNCRPLTSMATARPDNIQHYRPTRRCVFGPLPPFVLRS